MLSQDTFKIPASEISDGAGQRLKDAKGRRPPPTTRLTNYRDEADALPLAIGRRVQEAPLEKFVGLGGSARFKRGLLNHINAVRGSDGEVESSRSTLLP